MSRKWLMITALMVVTALTLAACGGKKATPAPTATMAPEPTAAPTESPTEAPTEAATESEVEATPTEGPAETEASGAIVALPSAGSPLEGTSWQLVSYVDDQGESQEPVAGAEPTISFEGGQASGTTGCNNYSGSYQATESELSFGPIASNLMACPEAQMAQEQAYLAALESVASYAMSDDELTMANEAGETVLTFAPREATKLTGTLWNAIGYNNGKGVITLVAGSEITAVFGEDGKLTGNAGCNDYTAAYEVDGENISISPAATTRKMCAEPEGVMEQEALYLAALTEANTYAIDGDRLQLRTAEGSLIADYQAAESVEAAATPVDEALMTALANMEYKSEMTKDGVAPLEDGEYSEEAAPGSASKIQVMLTDNVATGEIDGQPAVAVVLLSSGGGSGAFYDLALVMEQDGELVNVATANLGDRVQIESLSIADNQIVVDMVTQGPDDAMCCPTQQVERTYAYQDGELTQTNEAVLGTVEAAGVSASAGITETAGMTNTTETTATAEISGAAGAPAMGALPAAGSPLDGSSWQLVSYVDDQGETQEPAAGSEPTIAFEGGQAAGTTGCNNYAGDYQATESELSFGPLASTMMACPDAQMAQEQAYTAALGSVASYAMSDDQLTMANEAGETILTFVPREATKLTGTLWNAIGYNNGKQAVVSLIAGSEITAVFDKDGKLTGNAGCNNYTATYEVDGANISIGPAATTRKMCAEPEGVMEQEALYLAALTEADVYAIDGDRLQLRTAEGSLIADYRAGGQAETTPEPEAAAPVTEPAPENLTQQVVRPVPVLPTAQEAVSLDLGAVASSYQWEVIPATPYTVTGEPEPVGAPRHAVITFDGQTPEEAAVGGPIIYIYPRYGYEAIWREANDETISERMTELEAILEERPDQLHPPIPILPPVEGINDLAVQTAYLTLNGGSAVRGVGRAVEEAVPVTNEGLTYYAQGLSEDGQIYIAMRWPVGASVLPATLADLDQKQADEAANDFSAYMVETTRQLNELLPSDWQPNLLDLDSLISSLTIELGTADETTAAGAVDSDLVGPIWAWQETRRGDNDVTKAPDPTRYTIEFTDDGAVGIRADCNQVTGVYAASDGELQVTPLTSTQALCLPPSLEQEFLQELSAASTYALEDDVLTVATDVADGQMIFSPVQ